MFEFLSEFTQFDDAIHAIFQDKSSMILHYNDHFTYFDKCGQRSKLKVNNCRQSDNIYSKLLETLKVARRFTHLNPEQLEYEEVTKMKKISTIIWPIIPTQQGNILILKSLDGVASIKLNIETYQIDITYYEIKQTVAIVKDVENQFDFVNDFITKYNLNSTKPSTIQCNVGYTYWIISKIYSVINIPKIWVGPLAILLNSLTTTTDIIQQYGIPIPMELQEYLHCESNESEDCIQYFMRQYSCYKVGDQIITKIPTNDTNQGFATDSVPPTTNNISQMHLGIPIFMISGDTLLWFHKEGGIGQHNSQLLIRDGIFWQMNDQKWEQSIYTDKYQLNNFDVMCKHIQYKQKHVNLEQPITQFIASLYTIQSGDFNILREVDMYDIGHITILKNGTIKARFVDRTIVTFKYPPPTEIKILNSNGQSIRIQFNPPITEQYAYDTHYLITYIPQEWQYYLQHCIRLAEECFVVADIQRQRLQHETQLSTWVSNEVEKANRFLIVTGVQQFPGDVDFGMDVQRLLDANEEMLRSLRTPPPQGSQFDINF